MGIKQYANDNPELQDDADTWVGEVKSFEKVQSESVKIKKVEKKKRLEKINKEKKTLTKL